jgi:hypothetical protein
MLVRAGLWIVIVCATLSLVAGRDAAPALQAEVGNVGPPAPRAACAHADAERPAPTLLRRVEASLDHVETTLAAAADGLGRIRACMLADPSERSRWSPVRILH